MKALTLLLPAALVSELGWTLIHFLWQGTAIALLYALCQRLLRHNSANLRYLAGCLALLLMVLAPAFTLGHLAAKPAQPANSFPSRVTSPVPLPVEPVRASAPQLLSAPIAQPDKRTLISSSLRPVSFGESLDDLLPWVVRGWVAGVMILTVHFLTGWLKVRRIQRQSTLAPQEVWRFKLASLMEKMAVSRPVRLLQSAWVEVPTVIGCLKPVILVPASAFTGLSPDQLELLLAHELAHIRRHDYLVNTLQNAIEILLFYHPAVWWISRRIREEREHCCDDLAVVTCGNRLEYVRALATMEELRGLSPAWTVGAKGGSLLDRVRRLVRQPDPTPSQAGWWMAGLVVLVLGISLIAESWNSATAKDASATAASASTWTKTLESGVRVELLGVSPSPFRQSQAWWRPDGSALKEVPLNSLVRGAKDDPGGREFALHLSDARASVVCRFVPDGIASSYTRDTALKDGRLVPNLILLRANFPDNWQEPSKDIIRQASKVAQEELTKAEAMAADAEQLDKEVQASLKTTEPAKIPPIAASRKIRELVAKLAIEQEELTGLRTRYKDKYPEVMKQEGIVRNLRESIGVAATDFLQDLTRNAKIRRAEAERLKNKVNELQNQQLRFDQNHAKDVPPALETGHQQMTGIRTCDLRLGIALAPWESRLNLDLGQGSATHPDFKLLASESLDVYGETTVTVTLSRCKLQTRLMALSMEGREHEPTQATSTVANGDKTETTYRFALPAKQIHHYFLQTRPCEWVEFKGVSLYPNDLSAMILQPPTNQILRISVSSEHNISGDYKVSSNGTISFPLIGDVPVAGRDPESIAQEIKRKLEDYYKEVSVTVERANGSLTATPAPQPGTNAVPTKTAP